MAKHVALLGIVLLACTTLAKAWPALQNPNNQGPWNGNEVEKPFDVPKSLSYPIPNSPLMQGGPSNFDGSEGPRNPQYPGQQKSSPFSDPWGNNQQNGPFGQNPFEMNSQEPFPFDQNFNGINANEDFPYTRPYRNLFSQNQFPPPPPPRGPMMPESMYMQEQPHFPMGPNGPGAPNGPPRGHMMGNGQQMPPPPPPPQHQHHFGHMMGQNRPFELARINGRSNSPSEMFPPSTPFDFLTPRYPIEYSPIKPANGSIPAITVNYNVTYTFSPWGWKTVDVSVSNATFHTSASQKAVDILAAPGGGLVPMNEANKNPDMSMTSGWWWWPKKTGSEVDGKTPAGMGKPIDGMEPGFGDGPTLPHSVPPQ